MALKRCYEFQKRFEKCYQKDKKTPNLVTRQSFFKLITTITNDNRRTSHQYLIHRHIRHISTKFLRIWFIKCHKLNHLYNAEKILSAW